jgi:hypothetical protein
MFPVFQLEAQLRQNQSEFKRSQGKPPDLMSPNPFMLVSHAFPQSFSKDSELTVVSFEQWLCQR